MSVAHISAKYLCSLELNRICGQCVVRTQHQQQEIQVTECMCVCVCSLIYVCVQMCIISICLSTYLLPFILYRFWIDLFLLSYRVYRCFFSISTYWTQYTLLLLYSRVYLFVYLLFPFVLLSTKDFGDVPLSRTISLPHYLYK